MADVVLLTGPAAAGKTAAARAWASTRPFPAAHVSLDDVRDLLKSGHVNPEDGWTPEVARQLALARSIVADMAHRYDEHGVRLVVDDAIFPNWDVAGEEPWRAALRDLGYTLIDLLPSFEAVRERNRLRAGRKRLRNETLRVIYADMLGWRERGAAVIDNTDLTVQETVDSMERSLGGAT
jgi:chloramphenicol 3-O-phosphotransferase